MKSKTKLLIVLAIVVALIAGFLIGTTVNLSPADKSGLSGTIAKVNNYRNVKVSENDVKLRSELLDNEKLCRQLNRYFTFYYTSNAQMTYQIDKAQKAAATAQGFSERFSKEMNSLAGFNTYLAEARKDYLLVLSALKHLKDTDQQSMGMLLNNASNAVAQTKFRNQAVVDFIGSVIEYFKTEPKTKYPDLLAVHDALMINLIRNSTITGDKMMTRFLDKKVFLGTKESIGSDAWGDATVLNDMVISDIAGLQDMITVSDRLLLEDIFTISDKGKAEDQHSISDQGKIEDQHAISDQGKIEDQHSISDQSGLQHAPMLDVETLNDLLLCDVSQFLSSHKIGLESDFFFDAQALQSDLFSDMENLSSDLFGDAGFLNLINPNQ